MSFANRAEPKDLILPFAVVAVVGMMIFPLPLVLLDALLMCNLSLALALLVSSVYLAQPQKFTSLPTILLLTTLFRLGLNISTTRQLLSGGGAPDVILTFGNFVVGGNLIVGVVIFAIVTLVQFLVIAKGAERVAEVAARFTLDAMPGKQMAIDADIRSGILSLLEAKDRRRELQTESKLFGALDGAMKFVKGDAIAGLIITLINISAGLLVGVSQQGLSVSDALQRYTLYTIGDGLISQIPALLVAVAAGIAVTRVSETDSSFVGRDMIEQLSREPQALATTSIVLFCLALIPGLPFLSFTCMSLVFAVSAHRVWKQMRHQDQQSAESGFQPKTSAPVVLKISVSGTVELQRAGTLPNYLQKVRAEIFETKGVIVPDIHFEVDHGVDGLSLEFHLKGACVNRILKEETNSSFNNLVESELTRFLYQHLVDFIDDTHSRMLLEVHQASCEDLMNAVIPELLSVTGLTTILKQLVKEDVSIRYLPSILQGITEFRYAEEMANDGKPPQGKTEERVALLSAVRSSLKRVISRSVAGVEMNLHAWVLSSELDSLLVRTTSQSMSLDPRVVLELADALRSAAEADTGSDSVVVITSRYARSMLSAVIDAESLQAQAVAVDELVEEVNLELLGEITIGSILVSEGSEAMPTTPSGAPDEFAEGVLEEGGERGKLTVLGQAVVEQFPVRRPLDKAVGDGLE